MSVTIQNTPIKVGDVVQIIAHDEYQSAHSQNIIGVVVMVFCDEVKKTPSAYGVKSNGEVIYYFAEQISSVDGLKLSDLTPSEKRNRALELDIIDRVICKSI